MPGASLWLVPPRHHPLNGILQHLINHNIPAYFHERTHAEAGSHAISAHFFPHLTLTSDIDLSRLSPDPHTWLERLGVPTGKDVVVLFNGVGVGEKFTKKAFLNVDKQGVAGLGELCRWQAVLGGRQPEKFELERWLEDDWDPHVSLIYSDVPAYDGDRVEIEKVVAATGISMSGNGNLTGWTGGSIWLVPTDKSVKHWLPIAERKL